MGLDNYIHSSMRHLPEFMPSNYDIGSWSRAKAGWTYSFQGALVVDVLERITGVSLFNDVIANDLLHSMSHRLGMHLVKHIYRPDRARYRRSNYDVQLGTMRCINNVFGLLTEYDGWIKSSY